MAEPLRATAPTLVAPRKEPPKSVGQLLSREEETRHALSAVATKFLPPERAMRLAINAVRRNPKLQECDPVSFMGSLMSATGLGIEPNTVLQQAFLIPYKQRKPRRDQNNQIVKDERGGWLYDEYYECQFQIGYRGFIALMYRNELITEVQAEAIYTGDAFSHRKGTETYLSYEKSLERPENTELIGAFCYTRMVDRGQAFTVMPVEDILKSRAKSEAYRYLAKAVEEAENDRDRAKAEAKLAETPWVMWEERMAAKTAIKQHGGQQDLGHALALASDLDTLSDVGTLDIRQMADPNYAEAVVKGEETLETAEEAADGADEDTSQQQSPKAEPAQTAQETKPAQQAQSQQAQSAQQQQKPAQAPQEKPKPKPEMAGDQLFSE